MKKDIFEVWLKEFCSLVFIQSVQAFIFGLVLSVIVSTIVNNSPDKDSTSAMISVISIIGLASVSKIEDLVKKIFGVSSSIADPSMKGGMKGLATTMLAAKLAGNFFNNAKKFGTGATDAIGARKDVSKARKRYLRDVGNVNDNGLLTNASTTSAPVESTGDAEERRQLSEYGGFNDSGISAAIGGRGSASASGSASGSAGGMHTSSTAAANASANAKKLDAKDRDKINQIQDKYDDALSAAKKKKRDGIMRIASSGLETVGGIGGAMTGLALGAALGEGSEVIKLGLGGLGVGDKIGSMPMKGAQGLSDLSSDMKAIEKSKRDFVNYVDNNYADVKATINGRMTEYSKAKKTFEKIQNEINRSVNAGNME